MCRGQKNNATGVPELERALRVLSVEDVLDGNGEGSMSFDDRHDRVVDLADTDRQRLARRGPDDAAFDQRDEPAPAAQNQPVPGRRGPRIDTENEGLAAIRRMPPNDT